MPLPIPRTAVQRGPSARGVLGTALALALLHALPLVAQDAPKKPLALTASVSFVDAAGNTDVTTLSGDQRLEYAPTGSEWTLSEFVALVYGRTDGVTSANSLKLGGRADRAVTDRLSVFGGGSFERNRFAGIARRFEEIAGLAYLIVNGPRDRLSAELGASLNQQRSIDGTDDAFVAARVAGTYRHLFTEHAWVQQLAEFLPNLETGADRRINTETSLVAPLSERFAVKVAYTIRFDNLPEPGFVKTDRILSSGLQVTF
jgi:putative salt-induced outer membrane protein YdiY